MSTRFRSTELSPIPRLLGWLGLILMCCFTSAVFAGQVTLAVTSWPISTIAKLIILLFVPITPTRRPSANQW